MCLSPKPYGTAILGGTFDHFHKGHEALIKKAAEMADFVIIGLTTDNMARRTKDHPIAMYKEREKTLTDFLKTQGFRGVKIVSIDDPYGPALSLNDIDVIVVSGETKYRADEINELRIKKGLKPLKIVTIKQVLSEDGKPISSVRILRGEIDRNGKLIKK